MNCDSLIRFANKPQKKNKPNNAGFCQNKQVNVMYRLEEQRSCLRLLVAGKVY